MAKAKNTSPSQEQETAVVAPLSKEFIIAQYRDYVLSHGKRPASEYVFAKENGFNEVEFYKFFNSFQALENYVWLHHHHDVVEKLESEEVYSSYTVREKWLAYFFTLVESWKNDRSYIRFAARESNFNIGTPAQLRDWKYGFERYAELLLQEGIESGEIMSRPLIGARYADACWAQCLMILKFWMRDTTSNFEATDAAIEKMVNFGMDVLGRNAIDSGLDLAKFLWQNR